jgi:hypothetical protein
VLLWSSWIEVVVGGLRIWNRRGGLVCHKGLRIICERMADQDEELQQHQFRSLLREFGRYHTIGENGTKKVPDVGIVLLGSHSNRLGNVWEEVVGRCGNFVWYIIARSRGALPG